MKRLICMILAAAILAGICMTVFAEDDEDDSVVVPVDEAAADEEDENEDDSVIIPVDMEIQPEGEPESEPVRVMQYGDQGDDVVFLVDTPEQGHQAAYNVYVLDSMSGSDEVKKFAGESRIGDEFAPDWVMVSLEVLYFEAASRWDKAMDYVEVDRWADAMKVWMEIAGDTRNNIRRAAACYDTAIASWLLGDKALAYKWLDRADASYQLDASKSLRRLFNTLK